EPRHRAGHCPPNLRRPGLPRPADPGRRPGGRRLHRRRPPRPLPRPRPARPRLLGRGPDPRQTVTAPLPSSPIPAPELPPLCNGAVSPDPGGGTAREGGRPPAVRRRPLGPGYFPVTAQRLTASVA